jgi:choline-sulfatase
LSRFWTAARLVSLWFLAGAGALGFAAVATPAPRSAAPPNILWIVGDDMAAYVLGAYGNPQVRTPNLDRLAAQGMLFKNAFCNSPVCTASRQSFLTGRYPRSIGVTQLRTPLPEVELTLAEILHDHGYETGAIGKMHFNSSLRHGFEHRIDLEQHRQWLQKKGPAPLPPGIDVLPPWRPFRDPASVWLNSAGKPFGAVDQDMAGTWFAQQAADYLKQARDRPFFLMVSFYEPHSPFHFPVEFAGRHRAAEFQAPGSNAEEAWQVPEVFRSLSVEEKQGILAAYYTSAEFLDRNVGRVLDALEESGQSTNTLVIFIGDHGYSLGQHGRFEKHCGYDPAIRAPLIIRYPPQIKARQSCPALVELIDLFPTILDYTRVKVPANVQGQSLLPVLAGKKKNHREVVFIEYAENEEAYLRTARWKFIYGTGERLREDGYATGQTAPKPTVQLFDLQKDPEEKVNLATRPEQARRVRQFSEQLAAHLRRTARQPELNPKSADVEVVLRHGLQPRDVR